MKAKFEKVVAGEGRLFAAFENWGARFQVPYHFHPEVELTGIIDGHGSRIIGDHIEPFAPGDLVLIGAHVPHLYASTGSSPAGERRAGSACIQFIPEVFGPLYLESHDGVRVKRLLARAARGLSFSGRVAKEATARMRTLVQANGPGRYGRLVDLMEMLADCERARVLATPRFTPVSGSREASRVSRACGYIQQRFGQDITQAETAAHVALSPSAFSRMFSAGTGLTFTAFLTGVRISEACRELLETDDTIARIAFRCGFTNLSNFNRRFLELKGSTPREYRHSSST